LDRGDVPEQGARDVEYCCQCGRSALLPVLGRPLAQLNGGGLVFDDGAHAMPKRIQCPHCRRRFDSGERA